MILFTLAAIKGSTPSIFRLSRTMRCRPPTDPLFHPAALPGVFSASGSGFSLTFLAP